MSWWMPSPQYVPRLSNSVTAVTILLAGSAESEAQTKESSVSSKVGAIEPDPKSRYVG